MNVTKMFLQKMQGRSNFETICLSVKNFLVDLVDYKTWNTHSCLRQIPTKVLEFQQFYWLLLDGLFGDAVG